MSVVLRVQGLTREASSRVGLKRIEGVLIIIRRLEVYPGFFRILRDLLILLLISTTFLYRASSAKILRDSQSVIAKYLFKVE